MVGIEKSAQTIECDVLVVGGAAAGLTAAISAAAAGASVIVATKGKAGRSGNTVVAGPHIAAVLPNDGSEDSVDQHFRDTLAAGCYLNDRRLLALLVSRAGPQLLRLEDWGVRLLRSADGFVRRTPPGHSRARAILVDNHAFPVTTSGLSITLALHATADAMGVRFLDDAPAVRLLSADGLTCGALCLDVRRGQLLVVRAGSVVVAAGGGGRVFARTNNTRGICGDSYGLLLQAGATLRDMEFVQFYPTWMTTPFNAAIATPLFAEGAVLRNSRGERFMQRYDAVNLDMATRDLMCQAIFNEVRMGNGVGDEVYMDCTAAPERVFQEKFFILARDLRRGGIDPSRCWIKVGPTTHFFMGGAEVNEQCQTTVPGLLAAGEAVGGVHGANRLSGNALAEAIVFGSIAGASAARAGPSSLLPCYRQPMQGQSVTGRDPTSASRRHVERHLDSAFRRKLAFCPRDRSGLR